MIRRGIIEQVINNKSVKVRVPTLYKSADSPYATPTEQLSTATICYLPGVVPTYKVGDVVYVAYNEGDVGSPVVIGAMLTDKESGGISNIKASSVVSDINTILSSDTIIGNITPQEIKSLSGIRSNIQFQLDLLEKSKTSIFAQIQEPQTAVEGDVWTCADINSQINFKNDFKENHTYRKNSDGSWTDISNEIKLTDIENNLKKYIDTKIDEIKSEIVEQILLKMSKN